MKNFSIALTALALLSACQPATDSAASTVRSAPPLNSGIDFAGMDTTVRPQDDFFTYANGHWVETTEIPGVPLPLSPTAPGTRWNLPCREYAVVPPGRPER